MDQGFPRSGVLFGRFVGPLSVKARRNLSPQFREFLIEKHGIYVSLRQASEWGMRALQGTFSPLKSRLSSNKNKILDIILSVVLLHNFWTEYVGLNQISTVFNPHYGQYINIKAYSAGVCCCTIICITCIIWLLLLLLPILFARLLIADAALVRGLALRQFLDLLRRTASVSYTHLTLPTNREV